MAVYTKLNQKKIEEILSNYSLGKLDSFKGIEEGIENTNYFLSIEKKKFILTIYEKRVRSADLPFFSDLMSLLNKANFKCPAPISNNNNETITNFEGKKLMIVSFLEGRAKQNLSPANCKTIGSEVAKMHELTKSLKLNRQNDLSINSWRKLFNSVKDKCENIHKDLPKLIVENLNDVEKNWPKNLPKGIIHADLFHDNIFFIQDKFSGVIDFYFSCEDFFAFEIAICFNALCFDGLKSNLSFKFFVRSCILAISYPIDLQLAGDKFCFALPSRNETIINFFPLKSVIVWLLLFKTGAGHLKFALFKEVIRSEKKGRSSDFTLFS